TDLLAAIVAHGERMGANHQGPITPEQISAVQQWLLDHGREQEVPNVPLDPGNPEYVQILAEIQNNPTVVPSISPQEQTPPPPPAPPEGQPGAMPVPGMGETGGQPMSPLAHTAAEFLSPEQAQQRRIDNTTYQKGIGIPCSYCQGQVRNGICQNCGLPARNRAEDRTPQEFPPRAAADTIAERCPKCNSATTGMVGDSDHHARCHACDHIWKMNLLDDSGAAGSTSIAKTALHGGPVNLPAAEREEQTNQGHDEDSSLTWKDASGEPLQAGQE